MYQSSEYSMIKLERERTNDAIPKAFRGTKRIELALLLLDSKRKNTLKFTSKNSHWKKAKKQLKKETNGKCAYCEAPTSTVAHGDVEHFRPKDIYWWLAYCYDNYLFSCQICNQSFKVANFPFYGVQLEPNPPLPNPFPKGLSRNQRLALAAFLAPDPINDPEGLSMSKFMKACNKENPGLIDPYIIDPELYFKWVVDPVLKEVSIMPRNKKVRVIRIFQAVDQFLGLNREELRRIRWTTYSTLEILRRSLDSKSIKGSLRSDIKSQIKIMMANHYQFAAMVRYFVKEEWNLNLR